MSIGKTTIPQTTVRYYDQRGVYREQRFHIKEDLEAFERRLKTAGCQIVAVVV